MFLITALEIFLDYELCNCSPRNAQHTDFNSDLDYYNSYGFLLDLPNTSDAAEDYNNNLSTIPEACSDNSTINNNKRKNITENTAQNYINFDEDDLLGFLDDINIPNNYIGGEQTKETTLGSSISNQATASANAEDDACKSPQIKRNKIAIKSTENIFMFDNVNNYNNQSDININISSPPSPNNSEVEKQLSLAIQDLNNKMLDEVKQQYSAINKKIEKIKALFDKIIRLESAFENSEESFEFFINFIKEQESLLGNVTPQAEYNPRKDVSCINYLNLERSILSSKKSIEELKEEFGKFTDNMKNYFSKNMQNLIDIEVINLFVEVLELYLNTILKNENIILKYIDHAMAYFKFDYSSREHLVFDYPLKNIKIFSACMNSKYIYVVYGTHGDSVKCKILKISNIDKLERPSIHRFYISKDNSGYKRFDKLCKRILTDYDGRIYVLQMDKVSSSVLILNENFEEIDLIDSARISNDASVPNIPVIADMCLHENKLYLLDCENRYIYCYSSDLNHESKIEIPGDFAITKRNGYFGFSQNYVFIVNDKSFFAFIPNTQLFVEAKEKFINQTNSECISTGFICLNENMIVLNIRKILYLHAFKIENTGGELSFNYISKRLLGLNSFFSEKTTSVILKSPEDDKIKFIGFSGHNVKVVECN